MIWIQIILVTNLSPESKTPNKLDGFMHIKVPKSLAISKSLRSPRAIWSTEIQRLVEGLAKDFFALKFLIQTFDSKAEHSPMDLAHLR